MLVQEGAIGVLLTFTVLDAAGDPLDISTATIKKIRLRKPTGVMTEVTGVFVTDGSDGKLQYTTIANDLIGFGRWEAQAYVTTPTFTTGSDITTFDVDRNVNS